MDRSDLLEKVFVNLLSNAFKFTPEGGSVRIELTEEEDRVFIQVIDTGSGIQPGNLPHLFDRFYTEDRSMGTGIGLHLVKEYIHMHGGRSVWRASRDKGLPLRFACGKERRISRIAT